MPIVGEKRLFAIEWASVEDPRVTKSIHLCFWANGEQVGNYADEVYLHTTCSYLDAFISRACDRNWPEAISIPKEEIFSVTYQAIMHTPPNGDGMHEYIGRAEEKHIVDHTEASNLREIYHMDDIGQSCFYDTANIVLVSDQMADRQKLVWRNLHTMKLREVVLPYGYVERIGREFLLACAC